MLIVIACVLHTKEAEHTEQVLLTPQIGEAIHLSLPYLSVIALSTFVLIERAFSPILVIGLIVTFFFVLIRHILVRRQNKELLLTQMRFNQHLEEQIELRTQDLVRRKRCVISEQKNVRISI